MAREVTDRLEDPVDDGALGVELFPSNCAARQGELVKFVGGKASDLPKRDRPLRFASSAAR